MAVESFLSDPEQELPDVSAITEEEAKRYAESLREALEQWNREYYLEAAPSVPDQVYDRNFSFLLELEQRFPELQDRTSPTRRIGAPPVEELQSANHASPMLSLDSVLEPAPARRAIRQLLSQTRARPPLLLEPKLDGLSLEVVYAGGELSRAVTRGDGTTGDEVTANVRTIRSVPLRLHAQPPDELAVRGEVLISREAFSKLNRVRLEEGREPFANPRNAAAGGIRQLDSRAVAELPLDFLAYEILAVSDPPEPGDHPTHEQTLSNLKRWGFRVSSLNTPGFSFEDVERFRSDLIERRDSLSYELDGIVIKLNEHKAREALGVRDRSPRWAVAWKFPARREITQVREIAVQVGRTGKLTPVAIVDPVAIGGVTVSRVSLHNADEVQRLDVRVGDRIRLERAGDVIPHVVERVHQQGKERTDPFVMPSRCPSCGSQTVRDGAYHRCTNGLACPAQLSGAIEHYGSREALDIDRLGEKTSQLLVSHDLVRQLADLYRLSAAQVARLPGFADQSAEQLVGAIQESRQPTLAQFLYGLGIPGVGRHIAGVLANRYGSVDALMQAQMEELKDLPEVGKELASSIAGFFSSEQSLGAVESLLEVGVKPEAEQNSGSDALRGLTIVVTGTLESYSRDQITALIERNGGRATSSVSGNTDYLVAGEDPGSKLDQAKEYEVTVIDEHQLLQMLSEAP
jgi:DNA ligase (NAD+)